MIYPIPPILGRVSRFSIGTLQGALGVPYRCKKPFRDTFGDHFAAAVEFSLPDQPDLEKLDLELWNEDLQNLSTPELLGLSFSLEKYAENITLKNLADREPYVDALRKAGLK